MEADVKVYEHGKIDIVSAASHEYSILAGETFVFNMAEFFKVFADVTRLIIIYALLISDMCVCDISAFIGLNQSVISHHLRILRGARVIKSHRNGKTISYSLTDGHIEEIFSKGYEHVNE